MTEFQNPIFILGSQRSGTTMLRLMLNAHPDICVPHESVFITEFLPVLNEYGALSVRKNAEKLLDDVSCLPLVEKGGHIRDKDAILAHKLYSYQDFIQAVFHEYMLSQGKKLWCDKTPYYTDKIDILYCLFPQAKFIHVVRDGRDVALSQRKIEWLPNSIPVIAERWSWKTTICHKVGSVLPTGQFLEFRYEDLVSDTSTKLRELCEFIGVDYHESMLNFHKKAKEVVPDGSLKWHGNSVSKPDTSKIYGWKKKMSIADQTIFEQVSAETLELFGYERQSLPSSLISKLKNLYYNIFVRY